jgi:hypothetical protein
MDPELKKSLIKVLPEDRHLDRTYKDLRQLRSQGEPGNPIKNSFKLSDRLLYMV